MKRLRLKPWLSRCWIKDKDARLGPLDLDGEFAWAQRVFISEVERQYNAGKPVRIIVLKGRQVGISTVTEALLFSWCFLVPGSNQLVLGRDRENSETIFEMAKLMWSMWPLRNFFTTTRASTKRLSWRETMSNFRVETAKGKEVGRGSTYHAVHGSEVAFWEFADELIGSLGPALPNRHGTILILESTANGVGGYFYDEWNKAIRGESEFVPLFFPWWRHFEYKIRRHHLTEAELTSNERNLRDQVKSLYAFTLTLEQLAWRRRTIRTEGRGDEDWFRAEYPSWPDEAFLATGRNVFPLDALRDCYVPPGQVDEAGKTFGCTRGRLRNDNGKLTLWKEPDGPLHVYKMPDPKRRYQYVVGADPSRTTEGDPCCIQVMNRTTLEQVAVWHGWATQDDLAEQIAFLGYWYNEAIVNTEIEGGGGGVVAVLQHIGYPRIWRWKLPDRPLHKRGNVFGWSTNYKTKHWGIGQLQHYTHRRSLIIHDPETYHQMREYTNIDGLEMGPANRDGHDDAVMAFMIALMTNLTDEPPDMEKIYRMGPYGSGAAPSQISPEPFAMAGEYQELD